MLPPSVAKATRCPPLQGNAGDFFRLTNFFFFFLIIIPRSAFPTQILSGRANVVIKADISRPFDTLFQLAFSFQEIGKIEQLTVEISPSKILL